MAREETASSEDGYCLALLKYTSVQGSAPAVLHFILAQTPNYQHHCHQSASRLKA